LNIWKYRLLRSKDSRKFANYVDATLSGRLSRAARNSTEVDDAQEIPDAVPEGGGSVSIFGPLLRWPVIHVQILQRFKLGEVIEHSWLLIDSRSHLTRARSIRERKFAYKNMRKFSSSGSWQVPRCLLLG
jgi:hypothetical protein